MLHSELVEGVRQVVRSCFAELAPDRQVALTEHILVRDHVYCGRRFRSDELHAVWFIEEDEIKIYGPDHSVVRVLRASETLSTGTAERTHAA